MLGVSLKATLISPEAERTRALADEVKRAWGRHLERFRWVHWMTLTTKHQSMSATALAREFEARFIRTLSFCTQQPIRWVYVIEGTRTHTPHLHALVAGTEELSCRAVQKPWRFGISQVQKYSAERGATWYLTKTLGTESFDELVCNVSRRVPSRAKSPRHV